MRERVERQQLSSEEDLVADRSGWVVQAVRCNGSNGAFPVVGNHHLEIMC